MVEEKPLPFYQVKIIVDANIVFSGILKTDGKIGDLLINSKTHFDFIAPDFLRVEIQKQYTRLTKISGMTLDNVREAEFLVSLILLPFLHSDSILYPVHPNACPS